MKTAISATVLFICPFFSSISFAEENQSVIIPETQTQTLVRGDSRSPGEKEIIDTSFRATALLFLQENDGGMAMKCTATAFEKTNAVYRFWSAAHCIAQDDEEHEKVKIENTKIFLSFDETGTKMYIPAKILGVGYQHKGDDFAVLEVEVTDMRGLAPPVVPLAENSPQKDELLINIASPAGLGKLLFRGHVSLSSADRPLKVNDINWEGSMLLQIPAGFGSSGSSVVSLWQGGILGVIVGIWEGNIVAIPIEKFKKFWERIQSNTYPWYEPEDIK
ncbi:trypsin-like peptidase domain-containing protein [bacterium]|nr:trypsin-like peptidase domain-containing protein [bacterium]